MRRFLIDANLPMEVPTWRKQSFLFVAKIDEAWSDSEIWDYAQECPHDRHQGRRFFEPYHHCRTAAEGHSFQDRQHEASPTDSVYRREKWPAIERASKTHKLVNVYLDRIESIA